VLDVVLVVVLVVLLVAVLVAELVVSAVLLAAESVAGLDQLVDVSVVVWAAESDLELVVE